MPKAFLRDRRDPSRVYLFNENLARNPYLEQTDEPPPHMEATAVTKARAQASRMADDPMLEKVRDKHAAQLSAHTRASDDKVNRDISNRAQRGKALAAKQRELAPKLFEAALVAPAAAATSGLFESPTPIAAQSAEALFAQARDSDAQGLPTAQLPGG